MSLVLLVRWRNICLSHTQFLLLATRALWATADILPCRSRKRTQPPTTQHCLDYINEGDIEEELEEEEAQKLESEKQGQKNKIQQYMTSALVNSKVGSRTFYLPPVSQGLFFISAGFGRCLRDCFPPFRCVRVGGERRPKLKNLVLVGSE